VLESGSNLSVPHLFRVCCKKSGGARELIAGRTSVSAGGRNLAEHGNIQFKNYENKDPAIHMVLEILDVFCIRGFRELRQGCTSVRREGGATCLSIKHRALNGSSAESTPQNGSPVLAFGCSAAG
jgi:hypothetical protein